MGDSEPNRLWPEDAPGALALSVEAGWNQTAADWRLFIEYGAVFGVRRDGRLVATAATLPYDGPFGFVGMVLTSAAERHRGHATGLLGLAVDALRRDGRVPVLDATPAGEPVYAKQGFVPIDSLQRWSGMASGEPGGGRADPAPVAALDAGAFGARREFLFRDMLGRTGSSAIVEAHGGVMLRRGQRASHVGPLVAADERHATDLLERALARALGPVVLDVPLRWRGIAERLACLGFSPARPFTRMALGRADPFGDPARLFAVTGPEFG